MSTVKFFGVLIFISFIALGALADPGQIYGKIYTTKNKILEGPIRWDKNEAFWDDILDAYKELDNDSPRRFFDGGERHTNEIKVFGITVDGSDQAQSGIRMGHIKTLIPNGDNRVLLILKSGDKVELTNSSTDIGKNMRELLIEDKSDGMTDLFWDEINKIEFEPTPESQSEFGHRLYGTATAGSGESYTGFVCWDMDEVYDTDILDGKEGNHNRKIEFGEIKSIEIHSSKYSLVTLKDGRELQLSGSNDVSDGNRGIVISDLSMGRIFIPWSEFDFIKFQDPPAGPAYDSFNGGKKLHGTVYSEDGKKYTGDIKWDDDEEYTWEMLNGNYEDAQFDVEFSHIKSIEKISSSSSRVELEDGRSFKLKGSNDVNSENRGIYIQTGQDEIFLDWDEFMKVEFSK